MYSPLWKITHQNPSFLCTPPFEKSPIKTYRYYVLPSLKNHPSKAIGFVYSPLWKIPVFGRRLFGEIRYSTLLKSYFSIENGNVEHMGWDFYVNVKVCSNVDSYSGYAILKHFLITPEKNHNACQCAWRVAASKGPQTYYVRFRY